MFSPELFNCSIQPFTVVYLVDDEKVLLLRKPHDARMLPNEWIGIGGKIEPGEDLFEAARREFLEETGLSISDLHFQGTFAWFIESGSAGISHLITAKSHTGTIFEESNEGTLAWHDIESVSDLEDLTSYQRAFLPEMLQDSKFFYSGISVFDENHTRISYASSAPYFQRE